jgi:hopanoid biosynthesis associated RND transporter like protein HpnN
VFTQIHAAIETGIGRIIDFAQAHAWLVVAAAMVGAAGTAHYTLGHLAINTDTEEMLSKELPWRVAREAYKQDFPYFTDTIAIVVDGASADIARDAAAKLSAALHRDANVIRDVYFPPEDPFLRRNQFLYLDTEELNALADTLSAAQPFIARLSAESSTASLFSLLNRALDAPPDVEAHAIDPAMRRIATAVDELNQGDEIPMSWQALLMGDDTGASSHERSHRQIILVRPTLDFSALLPAETAIIAIRKTISDLELNAAHGVNVRLTGDAALSYDELQSVINGSQKAGTAALMMVLICLIVGLRSLTLVVATLTTLIVGLIFTAGFAVSCVGALNMISIAFAVLYVGLGVDFAIHICLRYREMLAQYPADEAVNNASRHVGVSLILCAITTAIGFFAFIPTAYRGVAELGIIAGVGMFVSLIVSIILLPALLHVLPAPRPPSRVAMLPDVVASFPRRHSRGVLAFAGIVWVLASLSIPGTDFDIDPVNLNDPHAESVLAFRELVQDPNQSPLTIAVTTNSAKHARELGGQLGKIPTVNSVRSLDSFVPVEQTDKLIIIDELALLLGYDLQLEPAGEPNPRADLVAIDNLLSSLSAIVAQPHHHLHAAAIILDNPLRTFRMSLDSASVDHDNLRKLGDKLLASFAGRISQLDDALNPSEITLNNLPLNIRQRWLSDSGQYRVEASPKTDLSKPGEMKRFVNAVRRVAGESATGAPIINLGASDAVKSAFIQAFSYAFFVIAGLLWVILRSMKETTIVLAPLILAGLVTAGASSVFSLPFNFANIIALPLLLGIGVDSALHILHRYKTALPAHGNLLQTSTARAVFFSALTTIVSFGNLASSTHAGTASMGIMLSIGVVSTLACTLLILPAILKQFMPIQPA